MAVTQCIVRTTEGDAGRRRVRAFSSALPTMQAMFAVVWHFWIAAVLVPAVLLTLGAMVGLYLRSVESTRYPKGR